MSFTALVGVAKRKGMHLDIYPSTVQKYLFACMSKTQLRSHKTKHMFPPSLPHTTYCPNPIALVCHMPQKPTHWYCPNPIALKYSEAYKVNLFIKKCFSLCSCNFRGFLNLKYTPQRNYNFHSFINKILLHTQSLHSCHEMSCYSIKVSFIQTLWCKKRIELSLGIEHIRTHNDQRNIPSPKVGRGLLSGNQ